jgi:uncharacterized membrane protein YhfC
MVSYLNLLSGLGMVAVAVVAVAYWYSKKHVKAIYFAYGALFWAVAIAIKLAMDFTISQPFYSWLSLYLPIDAAVLIAGLYLGLRTGILENGIVYLGVRFSKLKAMSFNDAVAVGIGFGAIEALLLGVLSLLTVYTFLASPDLMAFLPAASQQQFDLIFMPLPIIERLFTLFGHVFATVLTIYAVKLSDLKWFWIAAVYKTLLDGMIPLSNHYLAGMGGYLVFPLEAYVVVLGALGLWGLYWFGKKYGGAADAHKAGDKDTGH